MDQRPAARVAVLLDDALITISRAIGLLRRRNVATSGLAVGPHADGVARLRFDVGDVQAARRLALQLQKIIGVRDVVVVVAPPQGEDA
jgi:acetolactate synthase regulatory subunit